MNPFYPMCLVVLIAFITGNFVFEWLSDSKDWSQAIDRSWFQFVIVLTVAVIHRLEKM